LQTQELVHKAEENFPQSEKNEAIQKQANMGPGREAMPGEGQPAEGGLLHVSIRGVESGVLAYLS